MVLSSFLKKEESTRSPSLRLPVPRLFLSLSLRAAEAADADDAGDGEDAAGFVGCDVVVGIDDGVGEVAARLIDHVGDVVFAFGEDGGHTVRPCW